MFPPEKDRNDVLQKLNYVCKYHKSAIHVSDEISRPEARGQTLYASLFECHYRKEKNALLTCFSRPQFDLALP